MLELTRLNNHPIAINVDLIQWIEPAPDTTITLITGEKLVVREAYKDVLERVVEVHSPGRPFRAQFAVASSANHA
ncbi:Uncharacterized protein possibly involved in motility [Candidatus Koribacter versatilis Ellin345]|uniref:Uncharacterized protein possibly involved in motility n=1 Tax=Koribacter versatilis (strain Ellin345) TaxID=204669 RepID=Q1IMG5_KORVE|nr:flagellar FlbD family protein [Candidatus Koribacter versatilis]ABF41935.1 Uncharacterized protein possibly involved in motility [Candidatus Koribacter versatilis Ellin345]